VGEHERGGLELGAPLDGWVVADVIFFPCHARRACTRALDRLCQILVERSRDFVTLWRVIPAVLP
jgi:hypothetical protein